jgi:hypothetical protein
MGTSRVLLVGGFLEPKWHPAKIAETSIATVTKSLIFTTVIAPIMACSLEERRDEPGHHHECQQPRPGRRGK